MSFLVLGNLIVASPPPSSFFSYLIAYTSYPSSSSHTFVQLAYGTNSINPATTTDNSTTNATTITNYTGLEQNTKTFLLDMKAKNNPPINTLPPNEARAALSGLQSSYPVVIPEAQVQNQTIPVGPNNETMIQIVRPAGVSENQLLPVVMYFHGGGWVLGGFDTHERLIKELANNANVSVVYVNYTLSPEAKYPVALEEAYAATKWVAENGQEINVNSSRLAVAGDSVGGNMATAVTMLAKERGGPIISFQALFYPVTDVNFNTPSYLEYKNDYHLTRDAMIWFWTNYLDNKTTNIKDPLVSPLQASIEQLQGLPPTLVITDENDVLRDEEKHMLTSSWKQECLSPQLDTSEQSMTL